MKVLSFLGLILIFTNSGFSQWQQTNGTNSGAVTAISGTNNLVFAAVSGEGVYLSNDFGNNWSLSNVGLSNLNANSLATNGNKIFLGTGGGGLFVSSNNGANWTSINLGVANLGVSSFAINNTTLFVGTNAGVFLSIDNGVNWSPVNNGLPNSGITSLAMNGSGIYAGTQGSGVYFSNNNGNNWSAVNTGLSSSLIWYLVSSGSSIYAGIGQYPNHGIYVSHDNGANWSTTGFNKPTSGLAVSGGRIFASTFGYGVHLLANSGNGWSYENSGLSNPYINALAVVGNTLFAGTAGSTPTSSAVFKRIISEMTGLEELNSNESNDWLYPNPSIGKIFIKNNVQKIKSIFVYNAVGELIYTNPKEIEIPYQLDLGPIEKGIYFINLLEEDRILSKKVIIE